MKRIIYFILALALIFAVTTCTNCPTTPGNREVRELTSIEKTLVEADNSFGLKVFQAINKEDKDKNVFISPLSISMALGMTLNGANGTTKEAMQNALELAGLSDQQINENYQSLIDLLTGLDPKVKFQIANSIWYRNDFVFKESFINTNKQYFYAKVAGLDFTNPQSANIINGWVDENTNGKIKKIVDQIEAHIVMFLINAIYFKGTWTYEFDKSQTQDDLFYLPDGSQKTVPLMMLSRELAYYENDQFQAVDLPYGDGLFSMTIILPAEQINVDDFLATLSAENWNQWTGNFSNRNGVLYFPRFKLEYEKLLNDVLKSLGMAVGFDPGQADFTRMFDKVGDMNLFIDKVKHKSFVEVNEEGTEAAAVTSVEIGLTSVGPGSPFVMRVDRPFIFAIREHHSGTILFIGKIVDPS
ncbi:MAG: serpin family protein [candidate division KSB1 bacterium]|nr:serpin family protein [candidate division KSB1 bacterium]